jgi:hypothetical protein
VLRLSGDPGTVGRSVPAISLFDAAALEGATVTPLVVPDLRDEILAQPAPPPGSTPGARPPDPGAPSPASVSIDQADAAGEVAIGLAPGPAWTVPAMFAEEPAASPWILIRTLSTPPTDAADPTAAFVPWPASRAGDAGGMLAVAGVPAGIRLVVVGLVREGSLVADPATVRLAWVRVATLHLGATPR